VKERKGDDEEGGCEVNVAEIKSEEESK